MYLVQKNGTGVWYIVDTETGTDGKKKKIWRSTKTTERQEAEAILKEIEASRSLLEQQQARRSIKDLIVERALAASAVLVQQKTTFHMCFSTQVGSLELMSAKWTKISTKQCAPASRL